MPQVLSKNNDWHCRHDALELPDEFGAQTRRSQSSHQHNGWRLGLDAPEGLLVGEVDIETPSPSFLRYYFAQVNERVLVLAYQRYA
jgi:hypothetical protein